MPTKQRPALPNPILSTRFDSSLLEEASPWNFSLWSLRGLARAGSSMFISWTLDATNVKASGDTMWYPWPWHVLTCPGMFWPMASHGQDCLLPQSWVFLQVFSLRCLQRITQSELHMVNSTKVCLKTVYTQTDSHFDRDNDTSNIIQYQSLYRMRALPQFLGYFWFGAHGDTPLCLHSHRAKVCFSHSGAILVFSCLFDDVDANHSSIIKPWI